MSAEEEKTTKAEEEQHEESTATFDPVVSLFYRLD